MDQRGNRNSNWKGGPVLIVCKACSERFPCIRAEAHIRKFCGRRCRTAWDKTRKGERSPTWRGGHEAMVNRHRAKLGLPPKSPPSRRVCKRCGEDGVRKGRFYHPACSPRATIKHKWYVCSECGVTRKTFNLSQGKCGRCYARGLKGSVNPHWKGGITSENKRIRSSDEYATWRTAIFVRDDYTCVACGKRGGVLHADHIRPFAIYPGLRLDIDNGRTLCKPCHTLTPSYLGAGRRLAAIHRRAFRSTETIAAITVPASQP